MNVGGVPPTLFLTVIGIDDIDRSLHEADSNKIRVYRADYEYNRTSNSISFIPAVVSTSGHLHGELVCILCLQDHRETDLFFSVSTVQPYPETNQDHFHYIRVAFYSHLKSNVGNILVKSVVLRVNLNIDDDPISSRSHTHPRSHTHKSLDSYPCPSPLVSPSPVPPSVYETFRSSSFRFSSLITPRPLFMYPP